MSIFYKDKAPGFEPFYRETAAMKLAVVSDYNTKPYADDFSGDLAISPVEIYFPIKDLVPDEGVYETIIEKAEGCDYILAVGSGSLNDSCKYAGLKLGLPTGCLATAASMDGYLSGGAALMENEVKVTENARPPRDILVDPAILCAAPKDMTAAGFGDIAGKYTCLTDWQLSHIINGEAINEEAFAMMKDARDRLMNSFEELSSYTPEAVSTLMEALLTAGTSMAVCGNSRPASGSEHHMSHFLEMDFVRRKERIPYHGFKVAIGTLISIELYMHLAETAVPFPFRKEILALAETLPDLDRVRDMLVTMGCPVRFSELGVREETMREMLYNAYTVRDRYTILTFYHQYGLMPEMEETLMKKYW